MTTSLYDLTVPNYLQIGNALSGVLDKAATHFEAEGVALEEIASARLHPDMAQFRFQDFCIAYHSRAAVESLFSGEFLPPSGYDTLSYEELQTTLAGAMAALEEVDRAALEARAGSTVVFRLGGNELPFTAENFVQSFSMPNFHFHATTTYAILRARGVDIGKRDFLGAIRMGA